MSVCSLLQLDTVDGIVFNLLPLRFSSSSSSSLLSLLQTNKNVSGNFQGTQQVVCVFFDKP